MRTPAALLLCALSLTTPALAQATKAGDSIMVMIHHVRADKRTQYDSLMQNPSAICAYRHPTGQHVHVRLPLPDPSEGSKVVDGE